VPWKNKRREKRQIVVWKLLPRTPKRKEGRWGAANEASVTERIDQEGKRNWNILRLM